MTDIQTPPARVQSVEVARATAWFRANAVMIAAVALIGLSLWWKAILLAHSFFRLDDFFYLDRASHSGFTWHYLTWVDAGHLTPLGSALAWVLVKASPVDWTLTSAVTLVLLAVTCLAFLRMLRTFFGNHPGILILLGIYVLSPLSLSGLTWWTVTLELLPFQAAAFFAITAHVTYLKTADRKHAFAAVAWLFVAMASSLRGAGVALGLLALTSGFLIEGTWFRATRYALRRWWRLWLVYLTLAVSYAIVYGAVLRSSSISPGRPGSFSGVFGFARTMLGDDFVPGFVGGPWRWIGAGVSAEANPPGALAHASWVIVGAIIIISIFYRPKAWRAWAILVGWLVIVDMVPVILGRASFFPGVVLGLWTRYVWDATGIAALCLGLAFLPLAGQTSAHRQASRYYRPLRTAAACLITAAAIGSVVSFYNYPTDPDAALGRTYVATARIALSQAPNGTVILDDPVPAGVTGGQFVGPTAMAAPLLSPLINGLQQVKPRFISHADGTYGHLMEFDGWGRLVPATIAGASSVPLAAGKTCWPNRNGTIVVKLSSYPQNVSILRLGYISGSRGQLLVRYSGHTLLYRFHPGLQAGFIPVTGSDKTVEIDQVIGKLPCFGDVEAGVLVPSSTGPAIPATAVSG